MPTTPRRVHYTPKTSEECQAWQQRAAQIQQCQEAGLVTNAAIARALGVATVTVLRWRRHLGLPPAEVFSVHLAARYGPQAQADITRRYRAGEYLGSIGANYGISPEAVRLIAGKLGLPPRRGPYKYAREGAEQ